MDRNLFVHVDYVELLTKYNICIYFYTCCILFSFLPSHIFLNEIRSGMCTVALLVFKFGLNGSRCDNKLSIFILYQQPHVLNVSPWGWSLIKLWNPAEPSDFVSGPTDLSADHLSQKQNTYLPDCSRWVYFDSFYIYLLTY